MSTRRLLIEEDNTVRCECVSNNHDHEIGMCPRKAEPTNITTEGTGVFADDLCQHCRSLLGRDNFEFDY